MEKLVWRVKPVAETGGLTLEAGSRIAAAVRREVVRAQASAMGERFRYCGHRRSGPPSKGYRNMTFRSLYGDAPLRVRRFVGCRCRAGRDRPNTLSALTLGGGLSNLVTQTVALWSTAGSAAMTGWRFQPRS